MSFEYKVRQQTELGGFTILSMFIERHNEDDRIAIVRCFIPGTEENETDEIFLLVKDDGEGGFFAKKITNLTMDLLRDI